MRVAEHAVGRPIHRVGHHLNHPGKRAVAAIPRCKPYKLSLPMQAKKEYLVFDDANKQGRKVTKEAVIENDLKLLDF